MKQIPHIIRLYPIITKKCRNFSPLGRARPRNDAS